MLYPGPNGPSLVSNEFNDMCIEFRVEVTIQILSNPGDIFRSMRVITFRNFSDETIKVLQQDKRKSVHYIPGKGTVQVMIAPDESLPMFERIPDE